MSNSDQLIQSALNEVAACQKLTDLENIRVKYLGKTGLVTEELKTFQISQSKKKFKVRLLIILN